jgi:hypothetical protein
MNVPSYAALMCVLSRTDNSLFEMDGVTLWSQFKRLFKRKKKDQFRLDYVIKVLSLLALSLSPHSLSLSINQLCQGAASLLSVRVVNTRPLSLAPSHSLLSLPRTCALLSLSLLYLEGAAGQGRRRELRLGGARRGRHGHDPPRMRRGRLPLRALAHEQR